MTRKQVERMKVKRQNELNKKIESVTQMFIDSNLFNINEKFLNELNARLTTEEELLPHSIYDLCTNAEDEKFDFEQQFDFVHNMQDDLFEIRSLSCVSLERYLDSDPVFFNGDIIITDPCYILNKNHNDNEWSNCNYGEDLSKLGFKHWMSRDTIYGDWSCTAYNKNTAEKLGRFCADSGMVCVVDLQEVLAYNPDFDYHIEKPWTTTLIKNFAGSVRFIVHKYKSDFYVEVEGTGVDTAAVKSLNFITKQTGF